MVGRCDHVIRLPEISKGTTLEVAHGKELRIKIHCSSPKEVTDIGEEIMGASLDYIPKSQRSLPASNGRPSGTARS